MRLPVGAPVSNYCKSRDVWCKNRVRAVYVLAGF